MTKIISTTVSFSKNRLQIRASSLAVILTIAASTGVAQIRKPAHGSGLPPGQSRLLAAAPAGDADGKPSAVGTTSAATTPSQRPTSLLEMPPKQASIDASPDNLTICADNASLTQTLQRIADKTGMHLEGVSGDQRIFGTFGPGETRDVLNTLLTGTGYNIVMIGALDNGAPRQLILSQKKSSTSSANANPAPVQQDQNLAPQDDDATDSQPDDQPIPPQMAPPQHGGGDPTNGNGGVRTPQQLLQQMQQMRQQTDQQGNPQP